MKHQDCIDLLREAGDLLERGELSHNPQDPSDECRVVFRAGDIYALSDDIARLLDASLKDHDGQD